MNSVSRREIKYLVNRMTFLQKRNYLEKILQPDVHNKGDGYTVRSLYFDTIDDNDFFEKDAGIEIRRKIRLRIYSPKDDFAMLEMKQKQGNYQLKRSLKVTKEDAIKLSKGDYSCLLSYSEDFAKEMYAYMTLNVYKPKAVIEYHRYAFYAKENNIRITFDYDIVATEASYNIFDENLQMTPVMNNNDVVLEVKYNGFLLSYIKDTIRDISCVSTSVSKYYLSRNVFHKIIL